LEMEQRVLNLARETLAEGQLARVRKNNVSVRPIASL
jgi:hypothetical protein